MPSTYGTAQPLDIQHLTCCLQCEETFPPSCTFYITPQRRAVATVVKESNALENVGTWLLALTPD